MDTNAEIRKEAESGFTVDLSALVAQALQEKREKASEKYAHIEQTLDKYLFENPPTDLS